VPKKSGRHGLDKEKKTGQRREDGFGRSSKQIFNNVFKIRSMFQTTLRVCKYSGFVSFNENSKQRGRVYYKTIQSKIIK
jgi:hypothetical protein